MAEITERLRAACVGRPAKIAWPHRLLHDAANIIETQAGVIEDMRKALEFYAKHTGGPAHAVLAKLEQSDG